MVAVHAVADGPDDGPVVVLSGSLGSDLRMWEPQLAGLAAAGYRVVRYDHRGHGHSPVPTGPYALDDLGHDAVDLIAGLDRGRVHWAGLSLGGMVGMWLAVQRPELVATVTLCCTSAQLGPAKMWADRAKTVRSQGTEAVADGVVERWFTPDWRAVNPARLAYYRDMVAATPAEGYASCCAAIETMNLLPVLPGVTAPTLVISGSDDPATPPEHGRRIAEQIPDARLEVVDGAAHLGNVEQPEAFTELILQNLRSE